MAHEYQAGDKVKVLSGGYQSAAEAGLDATIVRQMSDAEDYEVEYATEQPGVSPIVHPDRLRLVSRESSASAASDAPVASGEASAEHAE